MAIGTAAAVLGGATLLGGVIQGNSMRNAATTQADAARDANWYQNQMFQQQRQDQQPWREAGARALSGLEDPSFQRTFNANDFQADPGYQFRMNEGLKAVNAGASARGQLNSGVTMKALTRYGQDLASSEYQNAYNRFNNDQSTRFNRLSSLAGVGQIANNQVGQAGMNYANQVGQNMMGAANANAAAQIGSANNMNNVIGQGMNTWMQYQMMNRMPSGSNFSNPATGGWVGNNSFGL